VSWFKKSFGVAVVLGATATFGCSGTNQLVGSDGLTVNGGNSGGGGSGGGGSGSKPGGAAAAAEPNYQLLQMVSSSSPDDERPYLCMPMALPVDTTGNADCYVLRATQSADCNCAAAGLSPTSEERARLARLQAKLDYPCDTPDSGACTDLCVCEVDRAVGTSLQQCQTESEPDESTTGWCYVSAAGGDAQSALVESCPSVQPQRLRFFGPVTEEKKVRSQVGTDPVLYLGCPFPKPVAPVGDPCISDEEYWPNFAGYSVNEVNINDHASMCESNVCIQNHFQGRASCPYGQAEGGGDCLVAGGYDSVTVPVAPQLRARRADRASICSCQCAGPGPGPYCTCSESMQCEHLVDVGDGDDRLAGSYCIPKFTQYDPQGDATPCSGRECGGSHKYD